MMRSLCFSRIRRRWSDETGDTLPFILLMMPVFIAAVGLAYDGGTIFVAKREALNAASAAARAGAADITEESLYAGNPELAPTAGSTAAGFAAGEGYDAVGVSFNGSKTKVKVTVTQDVDMAFLTIVGLDTVTVNEESIARVEVFADDE